MSEQFGVNVEDIFDTMAERFRPEGAEGVDASFGYDIDGKGKWRLTVKNGAMKIETAEDLSGCTAVTVTDADTFVGVNIGQIDAIKAFSSGKFRVEGDLGALGQTARMFRKYVPGRKEMTVRDFVLDMFATLEERFQPKNAEGLDVAITYDIQGHDGGCWTATIKDGTCVLKEDRVEKPTVRLEVSAADWVHVMLGKVDPMTLLSAGKAAIEGDTSLALRLGDIFAKYVPPGEIAKPEQELVRLKKIISIDQHFATGPVMAKFLQGLKEKRILANRCPKCGRLQLPPREICAVCRVRVDEIVEVGPKGYITINDIAYYASPDPLTGEIREAPYGSINVLLDGCKGNETFWHLLRRDQIFDVEEAWNEKKGTRVRPVWAENRSGSIRDILYFEIDTQGDGK